MNSKLIRFTTLAVAILDLPLATQAADLPQPSYKAPAYVSPSYSTWSGFYAGLNAGYGFGKSSVTNDVGTTGDFDVKGMQFGGTAGYNLQTGTWVWGIEGDLDYSGMKGSSTTFCAPACTVSNSWIGTARARVGYAGWTNWLPYVTGGAAFGNVKFEQNTTTDTQTKLGWTAGLGVEYMPYSN